MTDLNIQATKYTPAVQYDAIKKQLNLIGESYPENAAEFYDPVFAWLDKFLKAPENNQLNVTIELSYFNSSSSKILLDLFDMLEASAEIGKDIIVNWIYDEDDMDTLEFGRDFKEDFEILKFFLISNKDRERETT